MNPAASIILFTTLSGAGYGLAFLLGLGAALGALEAGPGASSALGLAFVAISAGLLCSTAHLGRPERAWRAFSQWRSSWLSREGVLAVVTFAPLLGLFWAFWTDGGGAGLFGLFAALGAAGTVYCTAMIYHQLPTVPRWRHWSTPACFLALALASGAPFGALTAHLFGGAALGFGALAVVAGMAAWWIKLRWWNATDGQEPTLTAGEALGFDADARARVLEPPHRGQNYLLDEMAFRIARKHSDPLRKYAFLLGFAAAPIASLLAILLSGGFFATLCALLASAAALIAVMIERWLFFAEARHVVTTYYGANAV